TSTAVSPMHTFSSPGTFVVTLSVSNADEEDDASRTFNVEGPPPPEPPDTVLLPWVAQSDGALDQVSALFVHNPDSEARSITLRFFERRAPSDTDPAPEISTTLEAGATAYFPDVLGTQFGMNNVSGFIEIQVDGEGAVAPTAVSYHRTFNPNGLTFGQAVPAVTAGDFPRSVEGENQSFHLMGLNDNGARLAFFGITNPGDLAAQFQLRFFNQLGEAIGNVPDPMSIGGKNNRQFQVEVLRQTFGIEETSDYRIQVEVLNNGPLYIYGANLRLPALDPSYVRAGDPTVGKVYLLGVLATEGLNNTQWQTDAVLANVADSVATAHITFTSAGNGAEPLEPIIQTLLPRETLRLANILADHFDLDADSSLGFVTIESDEADGVYPIVQAETYDVANPAGRFGQFMPALRDDQAAAAGQRQILTGLQQDAASRSTIWILNPGDEAGEYDLVYRALDGSEIGRISSYRVAAGSMRQINPGTHPLVDGVAEGGFTVQIVVRRGLLLSAAQVVNSITNDPAFVAGVTR
ncbi:MAG: PKD domain-containing protein, partial [Acidobacteria bacterium]|nr:PKD domain-containing protein [Acidobacteriota bacterium]